MKFTPLGGRQHALKRFFFSCLVALAAMSALILSTPAQPRNSTYPLHAGSRGQQVRDLQWLLAGHRPNVFTKVKPTFNAKPNGLYGARTKSAVKAYKYRIGYPAKGQCGAKSSQVTDTAASYFVQILKGHAQRPICWVAVAQQRVKLVEPGVSANALAIKQLELQQLGVREQPNGSNRGPCISITCRLGNLGLFGPYQGSTGQYGAAWCASFQQWAVHARTGWYFADRSAGVYYIEGWAHQHGFLSAKAKVGSLVAFLDDGGHIGYVIKVMASGYVTVEGNEGNAVKQVYHPWNDRLRVFINLPGVA